MKFVVQESGREYEFLLSQGLYIVGRHPTCDVCLDSPKVSRRHMSCAVSESEVRIEDLGSKNGIYVGGVRATRATLRHGDRIRVGDATIVFDAGPPEPQPAAAARGAAAPPLRAAEEAVSLEEEEETPFDESVLPQKLEGARPQLVEREGRWYAVDAASGKQVEVVPARRAEAPPARLLGRRRTRLVLAGAAAAVLVLFAAAIYRSVRRTDERQMSGTLYSHLVDSALRALDDNDVQAAKTLAARARAGLPDRESAKILQELVRLWQPWQEDFFGNWPKVQDALGELRRYHSSDTCRRFVKEYGDWINSELVYSEKFNRAKDALEAGQYEEAYELLSIEEIPQASVLRKEEADFFETVRERFLAHIREQMGAAAARRDWPTAEQWAMKLSRQFPALRDGAEQELKAFRQYQGHMRQLEQAREQLESGAFAEAAVTAGAIPQPSPHYEEARQLLGMARVGGTCREAVSLYAGGRGAAAVVLLKEDQSPACSSLREHIESVLDVFENASRAEKATNLIEAEHLWKRILDMQEAYFDREHPEFPSRTLIGRQDLANNHYYREASSRLATMEARRTRRAEELVAEGKRHYEMGRFAEARKSFEAALLVDPENRIGSEALEQMRSRGRRDYWSALNCLDTDKGRALELLRRACQLLPPDDKYYTAAQEKKRQLETEPSE